MYLSIPRSDTCGRLARSTRTFDTHDTDRATLRLSKQLERNQRERTCRHTCQSKYSDIKYLISNPTYVIYYQRYSDINRTSTNLVESGRCRRDALRTCSRRTRPCCSEREKSSPLELLGVTGGARPLSSKKAPKSPCDSSRSGDVFFLFFLY